MDEEQQQQAEAITRIMAPDLAHAEATARETNTRFVHYTNAEAALRILKDGYLWMRNATCMNDYNELRHGLRCVSEAFGTPAGQAYRDALDGCHPGLAAELDARFTDAAVNLLEHTYITCLSEHGDDEELYGRLSMWRAYGSRTGVALVFNNGPFLRSNTAFDVWFGPVLYLNAEGVGARIQTYAHHMNAGQDTLAALPRDQLRDAALRVLLYLVVYSKHKGFHEEREWRAVHFPSIWPSSAERLPLDQVAVDGVPQPVFRLQFTDYPDEGLVGATLPDLLNRVIIGPSQFHPAIRMALAQVLIGQGVENVGDKICCSDVTLRV